MSNLTISFSLALFASIISSYLLTYLQVPKEVAISISAAIMGFVPQFRDALDKRALILSGAPPKPIVSFDNYGISAYQYLRH